MAQVDVVTVENDEQRDVVPNETEACINLKEKKPGLGKGLEMARVGRSPTKQGNQDESTSLGWGERAAIN